MKSRDGRFWPVLSLWQPYRVGMVHLGNHIASEWLTLATVSRRNEWTTMPVHRVQTVKGATNPIQCPDNAPTCPLRPHHRPFLERHATIAAPVV